MHRAPHISIPCKQLRLTPCQMYEVNNYVLAQPEETRHDAPAVPPSSGIQWRSTKQKKCRTIKTSPNAEAPPTESYQSCLAPGRAGAEVSKQKGTPWECGFSLHSATTDTAHVPWFFHCFATIDNFCLVFLQWLNGTKIKTKTKKQETKKTKQTKWQDPTLCHYSPPWGVQSCFFFGFLFSGSLLIFWRAKDLDLTLCQFSHFRGCKRVFGWFYYLLWACGSIRKQCKKTMAKCRYHWRKLGGLGTQIRQFCLFM